MFKASLLIAIATALQVNPTDVAKALDVDGLVVESTPPEGGCGESRLVAPGDFLTMDYTGKIDERSETGEPGSVFDSSVGRAPFEFQIGQGQVIKGWDEGLIGMCVGETRTLIIGPEKGYGSAGAGESIPGGATLNFLVELKDIQDQAPAGENLFVKIDTDKTNLISKEEVIEFFHQTHGVDKEEAATTVDQIFEQEDQDADGHISWFEFSGPKGEAEPVHDEL